MGLRCAVIGLALLFWWQGNATLGDVTFVLAAYGLGSALGALAVSTRALPRRYLTVMMTMWGLGSLPLAMKTVSATGAHGLSEVLYAYTSATGNNGSAFAGLTAANPFWNTTLGLAMWFGRFGYAIPVLAMAGGLAAKPKLAASSGTFPTHGPLFVGLLIGVILILGGLCFFPALALGPIVEHFQVLAAVAGR